MSQESLLPGTSSVNQRAVVEDADEDTFKILIATDNHIGYLERDPIRGQDSFRTFEEILQLAEIEQVDFILLGGDLFHHNRPSRSCMYQTMKMLRRHCFGERSSKVWISSDQSVNFADEFCKANYLDENFNVKMPVFSIHGNHDDPSGVGNLCALNLLQVSGLVNYFGASQSIEEVEINPILMRKGNSMLALYGLGNIRDERLHRQWRSGHVNFVRGAPDDCFNLFVFHQNRARHGPTSHIPEEFIDGFIDLVFWGHEHECRIGPDEFHQFDVTQPGSSVATSLSEGEAAPKHVGLVKITGKQYEMTKIRLKTTRPLQFTTVVLARVEDLSKTDTKAIQRYLEGVVISLIEKASMDWAEQQRQSPHELPWEDPDMEMPMPLIRIRVDYSGGYETFNPQQFGQKFIDRVANPKDILKFQRAQTRTTIAKPSEMLSDLNTAIPERLDTLKVEDLVSELLSRDLFILPETGLEEAVMSLVEKSDKEAIRTFVSKSVAQTRASFTVIPEDLSLEYIKRKSAESKESQDQPRRQYGNAVPPTQEMRGDTNHVNNDSDDDLVASMTPTQRSHSGGSQQTLNSFPGSTRGSGRGRGARGGTRGTRARGRGRGSSTSTSTTSRKRRIEPDSDLEDQISEVSDDDNVDEYASTSAAAAPRARPNRRAASHAPTTSSSYVISSDEEQDDDDDDDDDDEVVVHRRNKRPAPASTPSPAPSPTPEPPAPTGNNKRRRVLPGS